MKCQCGSEEELWVHGHVQCAKCGRINDGDCCQGESASRRNKAYKDNRIRTHDVYYSPLKDK